MKEVITKTMDESKYVHRWKKDDHPVDPITTGWAPKWMTCRTCGDAIIDARIAAAIQTVK